MRDDQSIYRKEQIYRKEHYRSSAVEWAEEITLKKREAFLRRKNKKVKTKVAEKAVYADGSPREKRSCYACHRKIDEGEQYAQRLIEYVSSIYRTGFKQNFDVCLECATSGHGAWYQFGPCNLGHE